MSRSSYSLPLRSRRGRMRRVRVQLCCPLLLFLASGLTQALAMTSERPPVEVPPFPQPISLKAAKFKIVSEVIDELDVAARSQEEYVDLDSGQASFVSSTSSGHYVRHINAEEGLCFTYRPYKCLVKQMGDVPSDVRVKDVDQLASSDGERELWNFNIETTVELPDDIGLEAPSAGPNQPIKRATRMRPMRLFGVAGLWLMAAQKEKSFMRANIIYSAKSDVYRPALVWKVTRGDLEVEFYFMEHQHQQQQSQQQAKKIVVPDEDPTLETIKIASIKDRSLVRTINILSIERFIPPEAYDEVLSVPLGYGCFSSLLDAYANQSAESKFVELIKSRRAYVNRHNTSSTWTGRAELEVTATKAVAEPASSGGVPSMRRSSDTYSVELARTSIKAALTGAQAAAGPFVKLIRWRNSREDVKLVMHGILRAKHRVDMLRGSCHSDHMETAHDEQVLVRFANGAEFDANIELFKESDDLHFIKATSSSANKRPLHHYEGTAASPELIGWLTRSTGATEAEAKRTRVVRSYALDGDLPRLASMTIWLLDEREAQIRESYQIYVIDLHEEGANEPAEWRARQFDISYECYLENESMVQNRDYAWFQLSYPASQRILGLVASNADQLKQIYYERYVDDLTRVPRVELLLEEDRFKIRTLLLDLPRVEVVYDKLDKTQLVADEHDQVYMEPDLAHCAHWCRANHCTVLSYCWTAHTCTLSTRQLYAEQPDGKFVRLRDQFRLTKNANCETYTLPASMKRDNIHKKARLTSILARLQHQNYDPQVELPAAPEEITLSESGLSDKDREEAQANYTAKVEELLKRDNRLPELAFPVQLADNFLFLLPSKFELENDPLSEFGLHDYANEFDQGGSVDPFGSESYDVGDQRVPHFHTGLTMVRLNIAQMQSSLRPEDANLRQVSFHSFRGLNYDQCAMACWDSKCGTFSFCDQGGECILSSAKTLGHARALGLIESASDCVIAQRDFLGNFVKFPNVYRPQVYKRHSEKPILDPSECALNCVAETSFRCMSFQYCATIAGGAGSSSEDHPLGGQCYYQASHHSLNEEAPTETGCDHYARSQLADFVRVDARRVSAAIVEKLKTSTYTDVSVFGCADKCSNELVDCTAFQFCVHPGSDSSSSPSRECLTIESKITAGMLKSAYSKTIDQEATIVDETNDSGEIIQSGDYLSYDTDCQVFAMRRESIQAHLRDLAFGGLIRTSKDKQLNDDNDDGDDRKETTKMGWLGGMALYITVTVVTAGVTCGVLVLTKKSELVRQRIERLRILIGI